MNEATRKKRDPMARYADTDFSALSDSQFEQQKHQVFRIAKSIKDREAVEREARAILDAEGVTDDDAE